MSRLLLIILVSLALASCGTFRKVTSKTSSDSTHREDIKLATEAKVVTKTVVVEKLDTTIKVKPSTVEASKPLADVLKHGLKAENNGHTLEIVYDPTTGTLRGKASTTAKDIPVIVDRTTTSETKADTKQQLEASKESRVRTSTSDTQKERSGFRLPWWVWLVLIALLVYVVYRGGKRLFMP